MPCYYAHRVFGRAVLALLPDPLRGRLEDEGGAYEVGLYGPDPLFFYHFLTKNRPRMTGLLMHKQPVRPVAERLRRAVEEDLPLAHGYAAGFLCHFALDSRCHFYIEEQTALRGLSHAGMESELDRALMLRDGLDPLRDTPLPDPALPADFYRTVCQAAYPGVQPHQFEVAFRNFRRVSRLQTKLAGTGASRLTYWAGDRVPALASLRGSVLTRLPDPAYEGTTRDLLALLEGEAAPAARAIAAFFAPAGGALGDWYDRPFSGQWERDRRTPEESAGGDR